MCWLERIGSSSLARGFTRLGRAVRIWRQPGWHDPIRKRCSPGSYSKAYNKDGDEAQCGTESHVDYSGMISTGRRRVARLEPKILAHTSQRKGFGINKIQRSASGWGADLVSTKPVKIFRCPSLFYSDFFAKFPCSTCLTSNRSSRRRPKLQERCAIACQVMKALRRPGSGEQGRLSLTVTRVAMRSKYDLSSKPFLACACTSTDSLAKHPHSKVTRKGAKIASSAHIP